MKRLWQSLSQRIGAATRRADPDAEHVRNQVDAIVRDMHRCTSGNGQFNIAEFRRNVEWHLRTEHRIGIWRGADIAKSILKPHVRTEAR